MQEANSKHTTPTRRSAIGFSAAALLAGLTAPVMAEVRHGGALSDSDAELVAACAEAIRQNGIQGAINRGEFGDDEDVADAARDAWLEAFERAEEIPATTLEGVRAKARVLRLAVHDGVCAGVDWTVAEHGDLHDRMAYALCEEILALGDKA